MSNRRQPPPGQGPPPTRLLPHDPEAEAAVVGACCQDRKALEKAAGVLGRDDFFLERNRLVFEALLALHHHQAPPDLVTVTAELRQRHRLGTVGGSAAVAGLLDAVPTTANVDYYIRIVKDLARRRTVAEAYARGIERALTNGHAPAEPLHAIITDVEIALLAAQEERAGQEDASVGVDGFLSRPPDLTWDVEGVRLEGDHGWTGGGPKGMKGLTSLEEARACATGTPFLGRFVARKCRVLYVSEEDRPARLHRRVHAMLAGRPPEEIPGPDDLRFLVKAGVRLDTPDGLAVLRWHLERWRPDLVFLEHFDKLHSKDSNKAEQVKPLLDELDRFHASFGCTFRVQKHHRKQAAGQSKRAGEMLAGSVALFGWGESSIYLTLIRKGVAQVEVEAKDGDTAPRFLVEYQDGRIVYGGEVKTDRKEQARARVLEILDQTPGASTEVVAEGLKVSTRTALKRLGELEAAGLVEGKQDGFKAPKHWWRIPPSVKDGEG